MQSSMIVDLPFAPISVVMFLGAVMGLAAGILVALVALASKRARFAKLVAKAIVAGLGLYAVLLFGASFTSQERMLGKGVEKHYCEIDCHIAYSVTELHHEKAGTPLETASYKPKGELYVVTLRTRFDETTIGPQRGNGPLTPNPRAIYALDAAGHRYDPVRQTGTPLTQALRPGESYNTVFVFDLPTNVERPRLYVDNEPWPNHFLIGHEDSPLHKKAFFDLGWV